MHVVVTCSQCGTPCKIPSSAVGRLVKCPHCTTTFVASIETPPTPPSPTEIVAPAVTAAPPLVETASTREPAKTERRSAMPVLVIAAVGCVALLLAAVGGGLAVWFLMPRSAPATSPNAGPVAQSPENSKKDGKQPAPEDGKAKEEAKAKEELQAARRKSRKNLETIALAFLNHADTYMRFPPSVLVDQFHPPQPGSMKPGQQPTPKPLLSWRVLLLPFLEEDKLYREFKLDEPWDSEHNKKLLSRMPAIYAPVRGKTPQPYMTYYQVFTGQATPFPPPFWPQLRAPGMTADPTWGGSHFPAQIQDGTSNTLLVVEAGEPVPWTKPADLVYDDKKPLPLLGGQFDDGFYAACCDGSVHFIPRDFTEKDLRPWITANAGDVPQLSIPEEKKEPAAAKAPDQKQVRTADEPPVDDQSVQMWLTNVSSLSVAIRLKGVEGLSRVLQEARSNPKLQVHVASAVQALGRATADQDGQIAKAALAGLGLKGPRIRESVAFLLASPSEAMGSPAFVLEQMIPVFLRGGDETLAALQEILTDDDYELRGRAAFVLALINQREIVQEPDPKAPPGQGDLFKIPRAKYPAVDRALRERRERIESAAEVKPDSPDAPEKVLTLLEALHEPSSPQGHDLLRFHTVSALAGVGSLGRVAIPDLYPSEPQTATLLVARLKEADIPHPNGGRRVPPVADPQAPFADLQARLAGDAAVDVPDRLGLITALNTALDTPPGLADPRFRDLAGQAVGRLREMLRHSNEPDQSMPGGFVRPPGISDAELLRTVSPWPNLRSKAARLLGLLGPPARVAVPELKKMLKEKDDYCRLEAARALLILDPETRTEAVPVLRECLRKPALALDAALTLVHHNEVDRDICEALLGIFASSQGPLGLAPHFPHGNVDWNKEVGRLTPETQKSLLTVGKPLLQSEDIKKRRAAAWLLAPLDPEACMPVLLAILKDKSTPSEVEETERVLARLGPKGRAAFKPLCELLEKSHFEIAHPEYLFIALAHIDPEAAVPVLLKVWREPPDIKEGAPPPGIHWMTMPWDAYRQLAGLGPRARSAIPTLIADLKAANDEGSPWETKSPRATCRLLAAIGPECLPAVRELIADGKPLHRVWGADILGALRAAAKPAVPDLLKLLEDREPSVRRAAVVALGQIDPRDDKVAAALLARRQDSNVTVRRQVVRALGGVGASAGKVLTEALEDTDSDVRLGAAGALGRLGAAGVAGLRAALRHKDAPVRRLAVLSLGHLGPDTEGTIAALIEATRDRDPLTRRLAVSLLDHPGRDQASAVTAASKALADDAAEVRWTAAFVLEELTADAADAVPALAKALADERRPVRRRVLFALRSFGPRARPAVPEIKKVLTEAKNDEVRLVGDDLCADAAATLLRIADDPVALFADLLRTSTPRGREAAANALVHLGPLAVDAIIPLTEVKDSEVRVQAVRCLQQIGGPTEKIVPVFIRLLDDNNFVVRRAAIHALSVLGPSARDAIAPLTKIARDQRDPANRDASEALQRIAPMKSRAGP